MKRYPFIGLIGPSGSGKTTLITEALRQLPERCAIMRSTTTRPRRGPEDDISYEFVTREEITRRHEAGYLVNFSEYAENLYGFDRRILDTTLQQHIGLQALVESAIEPLKAAGYDLRIVKMIPEGKIDQRSEARKMADEARSHFEYTPDLVIVNRFSPQGPHEAIKTFIDYLKIL